MTVQHCFICAGADDDPGFDECAVCGRKGVPLPYGAPYGSASNRPADIAEPREESRLARGIRLARGEVMPEHVPGILQRIAIAKAGTPAQATQVSSDPTANADEPRQADGAFVLTVTATADGHEIAIDHPMGSDAWIKARDAMAAAHAELARHLAKQEECPAKPAAALTEADQCFEAALAEGWIDALANGDIERIRDIWQRRIAFAREALALPVGGSPACTDSAGAGPDGPGACDAQCQSELVAELVASLKGVIAVADRSTVEFDRAKAAVAQAEGQA